MTDKHKACSLEHQVEQARKIKRLKKDLQRWRVVLEELGCTSVTEALAELKALRAYRGR